MKLQKQEIEFRAFMAVLFPEQNLLDDSSKFLPRLNYAYGLINKFQMSDKDFKDFLACIGKKHKRNNWMPAEILNYYHLSVGDISMVV